MYAIGFNAYWRKPVFAPTTGQIWMPAVGKITDAALSLVWNNNKCA
jgi:hypothetical protein